jgi:hypothetical protein
MTDCPHCDGAGICEFNDALTIVRQIKADQTARAEVYLKRAGAITTDEAIKLLEGLQVDTEKDTVQQLGRVICLLLTIE